MKSALRIQFLFLIFFSGINFSYSQGHTLRDVFLELQKTQAGLSLYQRLLQNPKIRIEFTDGVSRTESLIKRYYDPIQDEEKQERETKVLINRYQSLMENTLDLAHELIHALNDPNWSPYDVDLTEEKFIRVSIENPGGEAPAIESECKVAIEFLKMNVLTSFERENIQKRCVLFLSDDSSSVDYTKLLKEIYKVGAIYSLDHFNFLRNIPHISFSKATLYSSVADKPYPLALLSEYEYINKIACENTQKRVLASSQSEQLAQAREFIQKRCEKKQPPST